MSAMQNGPSAPQVVLAGGTNLSKTLELGKLFVVGSSRSVDLRIPHPSVAPFQCELLWDGNSVVLRDKGTDFPTQVNGAPAGPERSMRGGDTITAGIFELQFLWEGGSQVADPLAAEGAMVVEAAAAADPAAPGSGGLTVLFRGETVTEVPLRHELTIGSRADADIVLPGIGVSPIHALIERGKEGFEVVDQGETGSLINGKYFDRRTLTIGDFLNIGGDYWFTYDGYALRRVAGASGCGLEAEGVAVRGSGRGASLILHNATFRAEPGHFVGILGPSGAGKTTLLRALSGLVATEEGQVLLDGIPVSEYPDLSRLLGFVPQQEIVHLELTGRMALTYAALLRLPKRTPMREIVRRINQLAERLGLTDHLDKRASSLSGGQLKRLSVCVELLSRPSLLFLDEPTSGLDPESETELMQQLQELTYTGCTVVCTTHVMENVYLLNHLEVVQAGRDASGKLVAGTSVFRGRPREAKEFFNVRAFTKLYQRLREKTPDDWRRMEGGLEQREAGRDPQANETGTVSMAPRLPRRWPVPILMRRQWSILMSDWKNLALLLGQPLLIGGLIVLVASGDNVAGTKLFLAYIATLWLGCSNAATEIVREKAIFRREQFVGLSARVYLFAKALWMGALTSLQALLLFSILKLFGEGLPGALHWQVLSLIGAAAAATGIGLAISAWAKTSLQAVLLVPVIIIPQILFSGFVFPVQDWNDSTPPRILSRFVPGFAAQRMMDASLLWDREIVNYFDLEEEGLNVAYDNLCTVLYPVRAWLSPAQEFAFTLDETKLYAPESATEDSPLEATRAVDWSQDAPPNYRVGAIFRFYLPILVGIGTLLAWTVTSLGAAWFLLRKRHP